VTRILKSLFLGGGPVTAVVICKMRILYAIFGLLLACGCSGTSTSDHLEVGPSDAAEHDQRRYTVMTEPPDAVLSRMEFDYARDNQEFRRRWVGEAAALPLDGQRAIELLEVACYADVMCHRIEYPLRVATLGYIEENMRTADVEVAVRWVQSSYESDLPVESPGDETGKFRGLLVEAMGIRMAEYAEELLQPRAPLQHRK
jgi:hypothetical protein